MKKKPISAAELAAKLDDDCNHIIKRRNYERMQGERSIFLLKDEKPILEELRDLGYNISSVWDLVNSSEKYDCAIPILLKHLQTEHLDRTKEGIARALAIPEAKSAWKTLVKEYKVTAEGHENGFRLGAKDGLAAALSVAVTDENLAELVDLAEDKSNGKSRVLLLSALRKSSNPLAAIATKKLSSDPELRREISSWKTL